SDAKFRTDDVNDSLTLVKIQKWNSVLLAILTKSLYLGACGVVVYLRAIAARRSGVIGCCKKPRCVEYGKFLFRKRLERLGGGDLVQKHEIDGEDGRVPIGLAHDVSVPYLLDDIARCHYATSTFSNCASHAPVLRRKSSKLSASALQLASMMFSEHPTV